MVISNNKKKLLRITTIPNSLRGLLKGQLRFMSKYFEVIAVSGGGVILEKVGIEEGIRTEQVDMERGISLLKDLISLLRLINLFRKEKPQIVHTHTPKAGLLGMLAAYLTRVPIRLHTVAGLPLMEETGVKRKVLDITEKLTYRCAHKVYPNSKGLKDFILKEKYIDKSKIKIIGNGSSNGINLDYYDPDIIDNIAVTELKQKYFISDDDFVYIYIGRVVKDKGIEELIHAFNIISIESKNVKLLILGNYEENLDPVSNKTKKIINSNKSIIFTGYQTDIRPFLKISNALVHPSYREGFPNVVLQGSAFNLPCIVSNINGCNEIIKDNLNGLLVRVKDQKDLYNKMLEILTNKELYALLKRNGRYLVQEKFDQKFVWEQILQEYKEMINDL